MKLLLVAATRAEIAPTLQKLEPHRVADIGETYLKGTLQVAVCITGVGLMAATYALTRALATGSYDLAIQAGMAGAYDPALPLGATVWVTTETLGDQGAEDNGAYLDTFELGLADPAAHPYDKGTLATLRPGVQHLIRLPEVSGLTINTVSGDTPTIDRRRAKYNCQVESMEGAALHYVCLHEGLPFAQVRSISNYVTPRDKSSWQMGPAINNLNDWLTGFLTDISVL